MGVILELIIGFTLHEILKWTYPVIYGRTDRRDVLSNYSDTVPAAIKDALE